MCIVFFVLCDFIDLPASDSHSSEIKMTTAPGLLVSSSQHFMVSKTVKKGWMEIFHHLCIQGQQDETIPENNTDKFDDQIDTAIPAIVGCDKDDNCYTILCCASARKTLVINIFGKMDVGSNLIALVNHEVSQKLYSVIFCVVMHLSIFCFNN